MSHEIFIPVVREILRAIVADKECCRLLGMALLHAEHELEDIKKADAERLEKLLMTAVKIKDERDNFAERLQKNSGTHPPT